MNAIIFASGPVGRKFLEFFVNFPKEKLTIESVVVCENANNPYSIKGKRDSAAVFALENGFDVKFSPDDLMKENKKYDIGLSLSNFHILKKTHIDLFENGIINFHGSPILWHKGSASPAFHILENDIPKWGYTYHMIAEEIDGGDIIEQVIFDIPEGLSSREINVLAAEKAIEKFPEFLEKLVNGELKKTPQKEFKDYKNLIPKRRKELFEKEITNIEITDANLAKLLKVYDWPEILEHPAIKVNEKQARVVPEKTYQEMLALFRRFNSENKR